MDTSNFNGYNSNENLYPIDNNIEKQSNKEENNFSFNLPSILQLLSLFNGKEKPNISSLLSSPLAKNLNIDPSVLSLVNLLSSNSKKVQAQSEKKAQIAKIDSFEKIKID